MYENTNMLSSSRLDSLDNNLSFLCMTSMSFGRVKCEFFKQLHYEIFCMSYIVLHISNYDSNFLLILDVDL